MSLERVDSVVYPGLYVRLQHLEAQWSISQAAWSVWPQAYFWGILLESGALPGQFMICISLTFRSETRPEWSGNVTAPFDLGYSLEWGNTHRAERWNFSQNPLLFLYMLKTQMSPPRLCPLDFFTFLCLPDGTSLFALSLCSRTPLLLLSLCELYWSCVHGWLHVHTHQTR